MGFLKKYLVLTTSYLSMMGVANAEPVLTFFASVGAAYGLSGAVATVVGAAIVSAAAISVYTTVSALFGGRIPDISRQGQQLPDIGATVPWPYVLGRARVPGAVNRWNSSGSNNEWAFESRILSVGPVDAIESVYFGNQQLTYGSPSGTSGRLVSSAPYSGGIAYLSYGLGDSGEVVDPMATAWGGVDGNYIHQPFAYLCYRLKADEAFAGQIPKVTAVVKGVKVYDPRDNTQSPTDPTTWKWSDNPVLLCAWYVMQSFSFNEPQDRIDWESIKVEANICDETVNTVSGTEKRYRAGLWIDEKSDRLDVLMKLTEAMAGDFIQPKTTGKWKFFAGAYSAPVYDIIEDDIINVETYSPHLPMNSRFTKIRGSFINPASDYQPEDYPTISSASALLEESNFELEKELNLDAVQSHTQAQRVASIILNQSRLQKTLVINMSRVGILITVGDRVTVTDSFYGLSSVVFRVLSSQISGNKVMLVLKEDNSSVYTPPTLTDLPPNQPIVNNTPTRGVGGGSPVDPYNVTTLQIY